MGFSNHAETGVLDHWFGAYSFTPSGTLYFALSTADPTDDNSGFVEPLVASGYARVAMDNDKTTWGYAAAGSIANAAEVTFPTAGGDWGTISHFAIMNTPSTSGARDLVVHGSLSAGRAVLNGDTPRFAVGDVTITVN